MFANVNITGVYGKLCENLRKLCVWVKQKGWKKKKIKLK